MPLHPTHAAALLLQDTRARGKARITLPQPPFSLDPVRHDD